jgi:hypothetical protein
LLRSAIRLACLVVGAVAIAALVAPRAGRAAPAIENCGSLSLGPGGVERGGTSGARCLLHAYQQHCRPAVYVLALFGVDTIATDRFRLARDNGRCRIDVTISFRVVPQPARQHAGVCRTLALKSAHVVAGRCSGASIPASIVLDPKPQAP